MTGLPTCPRTVAYELCIAPSFNGSWPLGGGKWHVLSGLPRSREYWVSRRAGRQYISSGGIMELGLHRVADARELIARDIGP